MSTNTRYCAEPIELSSFETTRLETLLDENSHARWRHFGLESIHADNPLLTTEPPLQETKTRLVSSVQDLVSQGREKEDSFVYNFASIFEVDVYSCQEDAHLPVSEIPLFVKELSLLFKAKPKEENVTRNPRLFREMDYGDPVIDCASGEEMNAFSTFQVENSDKKEPFIFLTLFMVIAQEQLSLLMIMIMRGKFKWSVAKNLQPKFIEDMTSDDFMKRIEKTGHTLSGYKATYLLCLAQWFDCTRETSFDTFWLSITTRMKSLSVYASSLVVCEDTRLYFVDCMIQSWTDTFSSTEEGEWIKVFLKRMNNGHDFAYEDVLLLDILAQEDESTQHELSCILKHKQDSKRCAKQDMLRSEASKKPNKQSAAPMFAKESKANMKRKRAQ